MVWACRGTWCDILKSDNINTIENRSDKNEFHEY